MHFCSYNIVLLWDYVKPEKKMYLKHNFILFFSVPPQAVVIMDDRGQKLKRLAGPYDEGASLSLLCEAEGG